MFSATNQLFCCFLKQIIILLKGKIMHVIEWVPTTVNRDGKNLRYIKSQKINLF